MLLPGTKIISGKTGSVIKAFHFLKKTYKNYYPAPTSKIVKNNGKTFFSNFDKVYQLEGTEPKEILDAGSFIEDFGFIGQSMAVITRQKISIYSSSLPTREMKKSQLYDYDGIITDNFILLSHQIPNDQKTQYDFYDQSLNKISSFQDYKKFVSAKGGNILLADDAGAVYNYSLEGREMGQVEIPIDENQYHGPQKAEIIASKDSDFYIEKDWPFNYRYMGYSGSLPSLNSTLSTVLDLGDLNADDSHEFLLVFGKDYSIQFFVMLRPKEKSFHKIAFSPSQSELLGILWDMDGKISLANKSLNQNSMQLNNINSQISSLNLQMTDANDTIRHKLQQQASQLQQQANDINSRNQQIFQEMNQLQNERNFWSSEDLERQMRIMSFAVLKDRIFAYLQSGRAYSVDLKTLEKHHIKPKNENQNFNFFISGADNLGDINGDGLDDIAATSQDAVAAIDGSDYGTIWQKQFSDENLRQPYMLGSTILVSTEKGILRISAKDGSLIGRESYNSLQSLGKINGVIFFWSEKGMIAASEKSSIMLDVQNFAFEKRNFASFYDCNNDGRKDILLAGRNGDNDLKILCADMQNGKFIKSFDVARSIHYEYQQQGRQSQSKLNGLDNIHLIGDLLAIEDESQMQQSSDFLTLHGNLLFDLKKEKAIAQSQYPFISSSGKIYSKDEELDLSPIISKPEITNFRENFDINFKKSGMKTIFVDNYFYTATEAGSLGMQLSSGKHAIMASATSKSYNSAAFDYLDVNVERKESKIPFVILGISLMIIMAFTAIRWKQTRK